MFKNLIYLVIVILIIIRQAPAQIGLPGWSGDVLVDGESTAQWSVEHDGPSSGTLTLDDGVFGQAVRLDWDLGAGAWVQAKYTFSSPVDLSSYDIFGLSLRGGDGPGNRVSIMLADTRGVFYGLDCDGINRISRWMINLSFPKSMFYHFFTIPNNGQSNEIDWSHIDRLFVVVKRPGAGAGAGGGSLFIDHVQADVAANWPRQTRFETAATNESAKIRAVGYVASRQQSSGLCVSWKEESPAKAWLYDQALALIVFSREGEWANGIPANAMAKSADKLAAFLVAHQKSDGHWARAWRAASGNELVNDLWVGDQAWCVLALSQYAETSGSQPAQQAAQRGGAWLADRIDANGFITASTEGTVDAWWAMIATGNDAKADVLQKRLLATLWDADRRYWLRGYGTRPDPAIAMDAATWVSEFARSPRVNRPDMAHAALSFVRRTLVASNSAGDIFGFDGQGPVSIWCEGTAQYISAGGADAHVFLDNLLSLQRDDGGMPGSTESWSGNCFGRLSNWTGLSSTAWLYFALTESPFANLLSSSVERPDAKLPQKLSLQKNYPNPFNQGTTIRYALPEAGLVSIRVYNMNGQRVADLVNADMPAGRHVVRWDGRTSAGQAAATGVYFYRLQFENRVLSRKFLLLR